MRWIRRLLAPASEPACLPERRGVRLVLESDARRAAEVASIAEAEGCSVAIVVADLASAKEIIRVLPVRRAVVGSDWFAALGICEEADVPTLESPTDDELRAWIRADERRVCG